VQDEIGAELERLLEVRGGERVVDDHEGADLVRCRRRRRDVDDVEQRVRRRLEPYELRGLVEVIREACRDLVGREKREPVALRLVHLREHPVGAPVDVVDGHHVVAGREEVHEGGRGPEPRRERVAVRGSLERGDAFLEGGSSRVGDPRIVVPLVDPDGLLHERRGLVDRGRERAGRRVRRLADVDRFRLELHRG